MLAIKNNIMAGNAARHLGTAYDALAQSVERLSSGLRINGAKDDAAGLAVRELIRADVAVLQQGSRNASDGISMLQTMEGAMAVIDENLIRMKELAEQAATGSYSEDQREIMNNEFVEMAAEIDRTVNSTQFNNNYMLNTSVGDIKIHVGTTETINIENKNMTQAGLEIETGSGGTEATGIATNGVATADTTFISLAAADGVMHVTFDVGAHGGGDDEKTIDVDFAIGDHTLNAVVEAINLISQNLGNDAEGNSLNYTAAEAVTVMDGATQKYTLKLSSRTGLADDLTIDMTGGTTLTGALGEDELDLVTGVLDVDADAAGINILDVDAAVDALAAITNAITNKDKARAAFGYKMNRLETTISILDIQAENLSTAESRISDVDVATEMATLTRNQVLSQAAISMLAQANAMPQMALTLLR